MTTETDATPIDDDIGAPSYPAQVANMILQNLDKVDDKDYASEIVPLLKESECETLTPVFQYCADFVKEHGYYPDGSFVRNKFPERMDPNTLEWSPHHLVELSTALKREVSSYKAQKLLQSGDFEGAHALLSTIPTTKKKKEFGPRDTIGEYERIIASPRGIMTGIKEMDDDLKGLSYATLTVVGAPPSMFKTSTMVSVLYNATQFSGYNGVAITLEVKKEHMWFHMLSRHSATMGNKIPAQSMIKGQMTEEQWAFYRTTLVDDYEAPGKNKGVLKIIDPTDFEGGMSYSSITRELLKFDSEMTKETGSGLDIVWLDYIQLMKFYRGKVDSDQFLNDMVRFFGNLSITFRGRGLIVVLNSQINRAGEMKLRKLKKGNLTMLAEINELERTANAVIVLFSDEGMRLSNQMMMQIVKNRNGKVQADMLNVYVDPECNLIGAPDFKSIYSQESINDLGLTSQSDEEFF